MACSSGVAPALRSGMAFALVRSNGNILSTVGDPGTYTSLALSPDETQVAVVQGYPGSDIWIYDLGKATGARFSTEAGSKAYPIWSPDGRSIYYLLRNDGAVSVVRRAAAGGQPETICLLPTMQQVHLVGFYSGWPVSSFREQGRKRSVPARPERSDASHPRVADCRLPAGANRAASAALAGWAPSVDHAARGRGRRSLPSRPWNDGSVSDDCSADSVFQ